MNTDHNDKLIASLVERYAAEAGTGPDTETVLSELIADLLHYADALPADRRVDPRGAVRIGETVAEKAVAFYEDDLSDELGPDHVLTSEFFG